MENNLNMNDIKNFLIGVSDHLKNELYSFNYQNTFKDHQEFKSDEENSKKLLSQCEILLNRLSIYSLECEKCSNDKHKTRFEENHQISKPLETNCSPYEVGLIRNDEKAFGSYDTVATEGNYEPYLVMNMKQKKQETNVNDYVDFKSSAGSFHRLSLNESFRNANHSNDFSSLTSTPITKRNSITNTLKSNDDHNYDLCSNLIDSNVKNNGKKTVHQNPIKSAIAKLSNEKLELERIPEKINNYRHKRSKSFDSNTEGKLINLKALSCPYIGLPLAHLAIYKSIKHGYLIRIEKRFLFDQTKKVYCGIINEWLLCYSCDGISDNPIKKIETTETFESNSGTNTSNENTEKYRFLNRNNNELRNRLSLCSNQLKPIQCIHLKDLTIEHYREGKRRDIQFQIYSNSGLENQRNKFIFQAQNEIDCKEWILAIEACKRGDFDEQLNPIEQIQIKQENFNDPTLQPPQFTINFANNLRRLPTPPQSPDPLCCCNMQNFNENNLDDIYEDPGAWLKAIEQNKVMGLQPPELPIKTNRKSLKSETSLESISGISNYDIPKNCKVKTDSKNQLEKKDSTDIDTIYEKYSTEHGQSSLITQTHIYDSPKKIDKSFDFDNNPSNATNNLNTKKLPLTPNHSRLHSEFKKAQFQINNIKNKNSASDDNNKLVLTKSSENNDQQQQAKELLPNKSSLHELNKNKEEFQMKIKNIHSKLSNQLLNNSPEQRYKKLQQNKKLNKSNNYDSEISSNKRSPIPIKNWFLNRIRANSNDNTLQ